MMYVAVMLLGVFGGVVSAYLALAIKRSQLDKQKRQQEAKLREIEEGLAAVEARKQELAASSANLSAERTKFDSRVVSYKDLRDENSILKHDLQNIDVNLRKLRLDRDLQQEAQEVIDK